MVKRTATGRARGTADAEPAIDEIVNLLGAVGNIAAAAYGPEMLFTPRESRTIAEPLGRMVSRYAGATERLRELSDPVLLAGGIASLVVPRVLRVMVGRAMRPAAAPPADAREVTFTETRTVREEATREAPFTQRTDPDTIMRTINRIAGVP